MGLYWWNPMYDDYEAAESLSRRLHRMNGLPCINGGGNVGTAAWVLAHAVLGRSYYDVCELHAASIESLSDHVLKLMRKGAGRPPVVSPRLGFRLLQ